MILNFLYVGLGGALGAVSRLGINEIFERISLNNFPVRTLVINLRKIILKKLKKKT